MSGLPTHLVKEFNVGNLEKGYVEQLNQYRIETWELRALIIESASMSIPAFGELAVRQNIFRHIGPTG